MAQIDKKDQRKAPVDMLGALYEPLCEAARVMEFGQSKYEDINNYKGIEDGERRFRAAAIRHLLQSAGGEALDAESHVSHLAHAAVDALMALQHALHPKAPAVVENATPSLPELYGGRPGSGVFLDDRFAPCDDPSTSFLWRR